MSETRPLETTPTDSSASRSRLVPRTLAILAFALVLHQSYKTRISPQFDYVGLTYRSPDTTTYAAMIALMVVVAGILPGTLRQVSDFMQWAIFLGVGAPTMLLAQYSTTLSVADATTFGAFVGLITIGIRVLVARNPLKNLTVLFAGNPSEVWLVLWIISGLTYVSLIAFIGVDLKYLAFSDVYDVRADFTDAATGVPFIGYLIPIQANVINPTFMAFGLWNKRPLVAAVGIMGQLVIYVTTGQKHILLSTLVVIAVAFMFRRRSSASATSMIVGITMAATAALVIDRITNGIVFTSLVVRRFLVIPGALSAAYVATFMDQPKGKFAEIFPFVDNGYDLAPSFIVGREFVGNVSTNANASFLGHGYFNLGLTGIALEAIILVVLLWLADACTRDRMPLAVACMIFAMPAVALTNGSVFTSILTNGMGAAIALAFLLPATTWSQSGAEGKAGPPPGKST